jgi:hypothetical protein
LEITIITVNTVVRIKQGTFLLICDMKSVHKTEDIQHLLNYFFFVYKFVIGKNSQAPKYFAMAATQNRAI